jgi:uncharacterized protein (DUF433 family)
MRYRLDPKKPRQLTPEEARRLAAASIDYCDIPPLADEFFSQAQRPMIDWTNCPDVERHPDRCSGAWCVKGTRVMVQGILDNAEDFTAEQIAREIYDLDVDVVRRLLDFASM